MTPARDGGRNHRPGPQSLIGKAKPNLFLAEATFEINEGSEFERSLGIGRFRRDLKVDYAALRPDLIQVFPARTFERYVLPSGDLGTMVAGDARLQLRVIDIKLTAEPTPSYFAEVAYYTMALAGWLIDSKLSDRFVVVPDGAIWPGSHDASRLTVTHHQLSSKGGQIPTQDLLDALEKDLVKVPFEVFAYRVRRFFQSDVPHVLDPGRPWQTLEWHVDNRCKNCEYLGYPWVNARGETTAHEDHCMPTAERLDVSPWGALDGDLMVLTPPLTCYRRNLAAPGSASGARDDRSAISRCRSA